MAKILWSSEPTVSEGDRLANSKVLEALGLPKHAGAGRLAVVGGGPSIRDHVDDIRSFETVWAVNGAINWCEDQGINAWFYTADAAPWPDNWTYDLTRVRKAVLTPDVSPSLIEHLRLRGAAITLTGPLQSGPTSANASDWLSIDAGYTQVVYFGCEGSFAEDKRTHAFESFPIPDWQIVEVGGEYYRTKAEFVSQSIMLANVIREFPTVFSEKSGGLLRAMVEHGPDYDVVMVSNSLYAKLTDAPNAEAA